MRRSALDAGRLGRHKHIVHGLLEIDVTIAQEKIKEIHRLTTEKISFTAFIIYCLGRAIDRHPKLHAYMNWLKQLVIYENVHVIAMIESEVEGERIPMPHLFENVDKASLLDIHKEMRDVQATAKSLPEWRYFKLFYKLPGPFRRLLSKMVLKVPRWFRKYSSPVMVTSIGMFGEGAGWGIPKSSFTLTTTLGGIAKKPWIVEGQVAIREILHLTLSINHDIIDGAPAARFVSDFRRLVESGAGLNKPNILNETIQEWEKGALVTD